MIFVIYVIFVAGPRNLLPNLDVMKEIENINNVKWGWLGKFDCVQTLNVCLVGINK